MENVDQQYYIYVDGRHDGQIHYYFPYIYKKIQTNSKTC